MAKRDRILGCFPSFYRTSDRTKLFHQVVTALAACLEETDAHLLRIQRAHRLKVAEQVEDVVRLAASLNLTPFHFEDLLADTTLDYDSRVELMRARVQRIARLHLLGLGTPWAVLEATAIFLNGRIVPGRPDGPLVAHLDDEYCSHQAMIESEVTKSKDRIYLHEGLFHRQKVEPAQRWQLDEWLLASTNVDPVPARFVIQGVADHTVRPSIFCPATGEGLWFDGVVPPGRTLVIDPFDGATMDGAPVDDWLVSFKGGIHDYSRCDGAVLVKEQAGAATSPFLGELDEVIASAIHVPPRLPSVPVGRSSWAFKVADGLYDASDFDLAVFEPPALPVGCFDGDFELDECVFDFPGAGIVGMGWDESIPCAFKVLLPPDAERAVSRIGAILPRFKAAGVRAVVDTALDAWILGESIVRDPAAADGDGVARRSTIVRHRLVDRLVPFGAVTGTTSTGDRDGR